METHFEHVSFLAGRCAKLLREEGPLVDRGDLLYDERGIQK